MLRYPKVLAALCIVLGLLPGQARTSSADQGTVIAIDILMEPDATMIQRAEAVNARLRSVYPKGFALDASHRPHISMFQCFVRTADLNKVYGAATRVFAGGNVTGLKLKAFKYYYIPDESLGLSGIVMESTPPLIKLQQDLIAAVSPFTVKTATSAAFVTTPAEPVISPLLITLRCSRWNMPASTSCRMSPRASLPENTWTKCWPNPLPRSRSRQLARPYITSASTGQQRRCLETWT